MSEKPAAPAKSSNISLWLPYASLALTLAAFGLGAPARVARLHLRPAALIAGLELDASIRYEPVVFSNPSGVRLVAAHRVLDELMSRQLVAFR
jgi:hypothetical protein